MNEYFSINDIDLTDEQKKSVLEWFARKLWVIETESTGDDYYGKSYDPLVIDLDKKVAHSYVLNLGTPGRHHSFETLESLEKRMVDGVIEKLIEQIKPFD